ncbi:uncharacterized protein METZ01_LOCUS366757 [marine metagenome]|jgi:methylase of polypeptide subunit release factors|uniref:Methyltransferase small domain-containing protein n=1 Tax=marine metagenome TaxID=408172 RepID=A0A382SVV3_9ZZZZ
MNYKFVSYYDTKIYWNDELDGCGHELIEDLQNATAELVGNKPINNTLEWCSGPGYWGFSLLGSHQTKTLTLSDIHAPVKPLVEYTIAQNNFENVEFYISDNFKNIPKQQFDLIVGNPPHFIIDPYIPTYNEPRKYKDEGWKIHEDFFNNVSDYLTDDGIIILVENRFGSNPEIFRPMIEKNNLRITNHFGSVKFPLDMWYLGVDKNPA